MCKALINEQRLSAAAEAVRVLTGTSDPLSVDEITGAIAAIDAEPALLWEQLLVGRDSGTTELVIPDYVTELALYRLANRGVTKLTVHEGVTKILSSAAYGMGELKTAGPIGGGYNYEFGWKTHIPANAFGHLGCVSLTLPPELLTIDGSITSPDLTELTIPALVSKITDESCYGRSMVNIFVDPANPYYKDIDGVLFTHDGKHLLNYSPARPDTSYTIPDETESLGVQAFLNCGKLTCLTFGKNMYQFGNIFTFSYMYHLETMKFRGKPKNGLSSNQLQLPLMILANLKDIYVPWSEGEVANAPWGAANAVIHYNWNPDEEEENAD